MKAKRGARIARARTKAGLSQRALAERIGHSNATLARIESGEISPSVDVALALSRELGESVESLFGGAR